MQPCPTRDDFERRLLGELDAESAARLDRHLAECPHCREEFRALQGDEAALDALRPILQPGDDSTVRSLLELGAANPTASHALEASAGRSVAAARDVLPRIEGYELIRVLGRGGMGVVYEAVQEKLGRRVALKLLPHVLSTSNPQLVTRFRREAAAAAQLHHTNIIPIYDSGECRDGYYYAMELIEGQPMNELIRRLAAIDAPRAVPTVLAELITGHSTADSDLGVSPGRLVGAVSDRDPGPVPGSGSSGTRTRPYYLEAARWIADAADAVHYAHKQRMIHRDLKPSNLMVCRDGRVMVLDFGLVKSAGDASVTTTGSLIGTYRYMSPEQIGAKRVPVDQRTDVYSLGATLYELLAFQPAFTAVEQPELLKQIMFKEPSPPKKIIPSVPSELQTICLKCLEKSPDARYGSAAELAADLRRYLHDLPIAARPAGPVRRSIRFVRRHRAGALTTLSTALLAVALAYALFLMDERRWDGFKNKVLDAQQKEDYAEVDAWCNKALTIYPKDWRFLVTCGGAKKDQFYDENEPALLEQAAELGRKAAQVAPQEYSPWNLLCVVYREQGLLEKAKEAFEEAKRANPAEYAPFVNLGLLHVKLGNLKLAEDTLRQGAERGGERAGVMPWHNLAAIQLLQGNPEAINTIEFAVRAAAKTPAYQPYVLRAKIRLQLADSLDPNGAYHDAIMADGLAAEEKEGPRRARVQRVLALAALRKDEFKEALDAARLALKSGDPLPAYPHLIAALAEAGQGRTNEAREHLNNAIAAWPAWIGGPGYGPGGKSNMLWFDSAVELQALRAEAERLLKNSTTEPASP